MRNITSLCCAILIGAVWTLAGCGSRGNGEIEWARAALARNPNVEIIAVDESKREFTVKDRTTGAIQILRVEEIAATPAVAPAAPATSADASAAAAAEATTPVAAGEPATVATESEQPLTEPAAVVSEAGPGQPVAAPTTDASGRLVAAGPGYSITRSTAATPVRADAVPTRAAPAEPTRAEPIICQGQRLMRIDGRTLQSTSDAIVAENGCDLHIINANIRANGIALVVRDARVHITNSTLTGGAASIEAGGTAEVFVTGSTFNGITRRFDAAVVNDLGGNQFR